MGEVYLARQLSLGRPVALKILALLPRSDPDQQIARFHRGAELMARVHHGNVVQVHDSGTVGGRPFLVMEYIEGGDLRQRMEPGRPLPRDQVQPLILPVAQALACLHAHGIVHRDLKPENILMHDGRTPMLTDFGLAVLDTDVGRLTQTDGTLGTMGYVAPEQQFRLAVDERADQYSMAAVFYELLTGHRPLGIFKPPSQLNPRLGEAVDSALLRALQEDPDDRYPTIVEFGAALDRALASAPVEARRRRLPSRTVAAVCAALLLAMIAPAGFQTWMGRSVAPVKRTLAAQPPAAVPVPGVQPARSAPTLPPRLINVLGMPLVLVPAGEFLMGSPDAEPAAKQNEKPSHRVRISRPYYLGAHEVTVGQFRAFVAATGYLTEAESSGEGGSVYNTAKKTFENIPHCNWRNPLLPRPQGDDEPVVQVSWNDAAAFCRWLSDQDHRPYRLPTEAEWEYACRGGTASRWCMGDDPAELAKFAWVRDQVGCTTHPVGRKQANAFDLSDMHGNVWEWCLDRFGLYSDQPQVDPQGVASGRMRVLRGGACARAEIDRTGSAARLNRGPSCRYHKYGFRVCCPVVEQAAGH
jgi:formylglycine-generating enzyme required for sulfatase activity